MERPRNETATPTSAPETDPASEFERWFEREYERVFAVIYLVGGSRRDAEDVSQAAFMRTWERWDHVRRLECPRSFTIRWALNPLRTRIRRARVAWRRRRHRRSGLDAFDDGRLDEVIRTVLQELQRRQRSALALVLDLDMTPRDTGRVLGRRPASIRSDLAAGQALIHERLPADTGSLDADDPVERIIDAVRRAGTPAPGAFERHLVSRRRREHRQRITTVAAVAVAAILVFAIGRSTGTESPVTPSGAADPTIDDADGRRHRLSGMLMEASVRVPEGWGLGDSIWGADGPGLAALSTGRRGARVSVAVFDLIMLSPFDPRTDHVRALTANGREAWFAGFRKSFERRETRLVGDVATDPRRFHAWDPLAWVVARAPDHSFIHVSQQRVDGREGSLVSFTNDGPTTELFEVFGTGTIAMRPGVTYGFWAPAPGEPLAGDVLIGIAREPGSTTDAPAWDVIGSLSLRGY